MATNAKEKPWTADELARLPEGWRYEIDDGTLIIREPAGFEHNEIVTAVALLTGVFVRDHDLGKVLASDTGVYVRRQPRETLRGVDVAYFSHERIARIADRRGFADVPPDLAVEVHERNEGDLARRVRQYLAAGVRAVWVVAPPDRSLTRHAPGEPTRRFTDADAAVEEPVLPGFRCRLRDLFGEA